MEESEVACMSSDNGRTFNWSNLRFYLLEPMIMILLFAYNLSSTVVQNEIIFQTCIGIFEHNETTCKLLNTINKSEETKKIEVEIQPYAAQIFMTINIIQSIVPALCGTLFCGWSDRFGRKPLLLIGFASYAVYYIFTTIVCYLCMAKVLTSPWNYIYPVAANAILGSNITYSVAAICYITDVTNTRQRPYRMAFYEGAIYLGLMFGALSAGNLLEATNSRFIFITSASTIIVAFLIIAIFVPESLGQSEDSSSSGTVPPIEGAYCFNSWKTLWRIALKPRPNNNRIILWLIIICPLLSTFMIDGAMSVFYLYIRKQLNWTVKEFTNFESVKTFVPLIGNFVGMWILRKCLHLSLFNLAIMAYLSEASSKFIQGFAKADWLMYLSVFTGVFKSFGNPMCRTIISEIVPPNELGSVFSLISALFALQPFLATYAYTSLYTHTIKTFPGLFCICGGVGCLIIVTLLTISMYLSSSRRAQYDLIAS